MRKRKRFFFSVLLIVFFLAFVPLGFFYHALLLESEEPEELQSQFDASRFYSDLLKFNQSECAFFPSNIAKTHPQCLRKMQWLQKGWRSHTCYSQQLVDGSLCSFRRYLSVVERFCPLVDNKEINLQNEELHFAEINKDYEELFSRMSDVPENYLYMKSRITKFWPNWVRGINEATAKYPKTFQRRKRLNIIVLIGFLANESSIKFAQKSGQGGPLGELLQWSDLIAALSILGHNLHIASDRNTLKSIVNDYSDNQPCPFADGQSSQIDLIFTDIMGLRLFRRHKSFITANKCRVRLLDSFGTHAEFSNKNYFLTHRDELSGLYSRKNPWGGHGLRLQQHWTFYPHSHDNTFLGFVVDDAASRGESAENQKTLFSRDSKDAALVYGKEQYMWKGVERPIEILKEMTEVHATVADALNVTSLDLFKNVVNHGFLHADQISALLKSVKIFFGMGFPLEGPAPLEAIANGAVFINAAFREPKTRRNNKFLSEKPTLREWTSQCPYMEEFGPPHVYTIDINNEEVLRETIRKALTNKPSPIVPEEFSTRGMLLRVSRLVQKQDFCGQMDEIAWPPVDALKIVLSSPEKLESCESACWRHRFVCEPTFFPLVNRHEQILEHNSSCRELVRRVASPLAPFNCELQASPQLFSCASRPSSAETAVTRLCPCRDFLSQQQALCSDCL